MSTLTEKYKQRELETIAIEESLYPEIITGNLTRAGAHYLATHPIALRRWRDDKEYFDSLSE